MSIFNSQTQIFWKIAALKKFADLKMSKFSAVATSFFLGVTRRKKNEVNDLAFITSMGNGGGRS